MTALPPGWAETRLGAVAETRLGKMLSRKAKVSAEPRPYLRNKSVQWGCIDIDDLPTMDFEPDELERFQVIDGDLLVCEGGEVGRAAIWRGQLAWVGYQKALHRVRPSGGVSPEFLLYCFMWLAQSNALEKHVAGSTIKHLPQEDLRQIAVPLPPPNEQRRIVAAIEEQFSRLDAGGASLGAAGRRLDAIRGLTLQMITQLPGDRITVGDAAEVQGGIQKQPKRRPVKNRYPFLRVANVLRGELDLADVHQIELFDGELERFALRDGDLLVVEGNGSVDQIGRSALWRGEIDPCVHQNHLIRVRPGPSLDPLYLDLYWNAPSTAHRISGVASSTSGLFTLSATKVRAVQITIPPLHEQRQMVKHVGEQISAIAGLRAAIERAQRRSASLRRAILERAFRGELVPQDPSDEPASVLLERIRSERAATSVQPRRRRATA